MEFLAACFQEDSIVVLEASDWRWSIEIHVKREDYLGYQRTGVDWRTLLRSHEFLGAFNLVAVDRIEFYYHDSQE